MMRHIYCVSYFIQTRRKYKYIRSVRIAYVVRLNVVQKFCSVSILGHHRIPFHYFILSFILYLYPQSTRFSAENLLQNCINVSGRIPQ